MWKKVEAYGETLIIIITNRKLLFKEVNELKGPYLRNVGVPQGTVLSPLLYNLYIIVLSKIIKHPSNRIISIRR